MPINLVSNISTERTAGKPAEREDAKKVTPSSPIGVFDSGVGGLTVIKEIMRQLPNEDFIYLADTAHLPYGGKTPEEIIKYNEEIIPFLIDRGAKLIIMACGTSSALAYPVVKDKYKAQIISLIEPGAKSALAASSGQKIGVVATIGTINSNAYPEKIRSLDPKAEVFSQACPLFVPLIESGFTENEEARKVAAEYLKPLLKENIDTLILGCTHYPHLTKIIHEIAGPGVRLVDPAESAVEEAKKLLSKAHTIKKNNPHPKYEYFVTGPVAPFVEVGSRLLGRPIQPAKHVTLS